MGIPASLAWRNAIGKQFRYQGYLWIGVSIEPPGLREGTVITASQTNYLFNVDAINDGLSDAVEPMATYERGRWQANGSQYLPSKIPEQNFSIYSWADETIVHTPVAFTSLFFQFDQTYTIPGIFGVWDTETHSWPTRLIIRGYGLSGVLLDTYVIESIASEREFTACPFVDVYRIEMEVQGWSRPEWRARVCEITFGLLISFSGKQILRASAKSKVDPLAGKLPQIDTSTTLTNFLNEFDPLGQTGYSRYLIPKQVVTWQWGLETSPGHIEKLPQQTFFLTKSKVPTNTPQFELQAGTRLDFLTNDYDKGEFTDIPISLYDLLVDALSNMKLLPSFDGEQPWELDAGLQNLMTIAPIPVVAENVVIQLIANAAGMVLDIDPINGYIRIHPPADLDAMGPDEMYTITKKNTYGDPEIEIQERLLSVRVGVNQYSRAPARSEIYRSRLKFSGTQELSINYNDNKLALEVAVGSITGGTVVSATFFSRRAVLVVSSTNPNVEVEIALTGVVYEENVTFFETYRNNTLDKGLEITVENPFITNTTFLQPITAAVLNVYLRRHIASASYQGFPEILGSDAAVLQSRYGDTNGYVLDNTVDYNGGWSGDISVRVKGAD